MGEGQGHPFQCYGALYQFHMDLALCIVSLSESKKDKYHHMIQEWESRPKHTLDKVQKLYGKLLHACHIVPSGQAHLTNLKAFMGQFHHCPFCPHSPPCRTVGDLQWWKARLTQPTLSRSIPSPIPIINANAYSDTSSETGVGIMINDKWKAWRLLPGWKVDRRDIGWAEAVSFLLLILTLTSSIPKGAHVKVFGDNRGVVEGWWKGRSQNRPTNDIFRDIHTFMEEENVSIHT